MQYWYTGQIRNFRVQVIRAFSNIYIQTGPDSTGTTTLSQVPCMYGVPSRMAATILAGNSENKIPPAPFITCTVSGLAMNASRRQDPTFVGKIRVNEREYDAENGRYLQTVGNKYLIERYMPVPYDLSMQVDIWSNNLQVKEQILEQILVLFNPSIEIQTSVNPLDWTTISIIELEDITWSSRSIPIGADNPIEVTTLRFKVPIWINPPAKVKKQVIIQEIITNVISGIKEVPEQWGWSEYQLLNRTIVTPGNRHIALTFNGNTYSISLRTDSNKIIGPIVEPTENLTISNPIFTSGTSFSFNGAVVNITDTSLSGVESSCRAALSKSLNECEIFNYEHIKFSNKTGGNNIFANIIGTPVNDMGLLPITYIGGTLSWRRFFDMYGALKPYSQFGANASQLRLVLDIEDPNSDIVGWVDLDPVDQNLLTWTIDSESLPSVTLSSINAIVDPTKSGPGFGLPDVTQGQRYLICENTSAQSQAWGSLIANANDIIQFDGQKWVVSFNSIHEIDTTQYLINNFNCKLLIWSNGRWDEFIKNHYNQGEWRIYM